MKEKRKRIKKRKKEEYLDKNHAHSLTSLVSQDLHINQNNNNNNNKNNKQYNNNN